MIYKNSSFFKNILKNLINTLCNILFYVPFLVNNILTLQVAPLANLNGIKVPTRDFQNTDISIFVRGMFPVILINLYSAVGLYTRLGL
jgi:hypothetical protein